MSVLMWPVRFFAMLFQSAMLALGQVWANKLRSVLTTLGIIIGVAAVTAVIAAMTGMKEFVLTEFESFGTKKIFMMATWPSEGRHVHASWRVIRFEPDQFNGWERDCPSVESLSRIRSIGGRIKYGDRTIDAASVTGIEPDWHEIEQRFVIQGRPFSKTDQDQAAQVCLISPQVRNDLRMDRDCIGDAILLNDRRFIVVGVLEDMPQSAMFRGASTSAEIFIPFSTAWRMDDGWMYAMATSTTAESSPDAVAELRALLRKSRRLRPDDPDTFRMEVMQEFLEQFNQMASVMTMVAVGIVGISLLVGGIGIMNIMLVSVSERTREIGLRKAVGANPAAVLLQFLVEAVVLCLIGGLIGLGGGQVLTWLIVMASQQLGEGGGGLGMARISMMAVILAIGFSTFVGVTFGMFPAIKAAMLDPIDALRHE